MGPEGERTQAALEALAAALERVAGDAAELAVRTRARRAQLDDGVRLADVLGAEPGRLIISEVGDLVERLVDAGAEVRRAEAVQLRAEGWSQAEIAARYGVTRQRVAALLSGPSGGP